MPILETSKAFAPVKPPLSPLIVSPNVAYALPVMCVQLLSSVAASVSLSRRQVWLTNSGTPIICKAFIDYSVFPEISKNCTHLKTNWYSCITLSTNEMYQNEQTHHRLLSGLEHGHKAVPPLSKHPSFVKSRLNQYPIALEISALKVGSFTNSSPPANPPCQDAAIVTVQCDLLSAA